MAPLKWRVPPRADDLRGREEGEDVDWKRKEKWKAVAGVGALAVGAYFTIFSTEKIVSAVGLSKFIGGLFITAPIAALPEVLREVLGRMVQEIADVGKVESAPAMEARSMTMVLAPLK